MRMYSQSRVIRSGFTLIELMIVVMIVLLLVALATSAVLKFRNTGPYTATVMNMQKIKAGFATQLKAVRDQAQKEPIPSTFVPYLNTLSQYQAPNAIQSATDLRVRTEYIKARLRQAFPMTFNEAVNPTPLSPFAPYQQYLTGSVANGGLALTAAQLTSTPVDVQQAVCFQMIVSRGPSNSGLAPDVLGTSASMRFPLPNNQQAYGCVDAWGRPLYFTRRYGGVDFTPAILSAGADGRLGIDTSALPATPDSFTMTVNNAVDAEDNILSRDQ